MGHPLLSPLLFLVATCIPASWALRCMLCERTGSCLEGECAPGEDRCRTTVVSVWKAGGEELEVVERGCAHTEKYNRTLSYRTGLEIITLTEATCETPLCNRPQPVGRTVTFPRGRYLECASCASSDRSCERGRAQSLQCRSPGEQCLEVVTHWNLPQEENPVHERHILGCGYIPGCPGPTGFHNNHTFHFLRCCNTTKCNAGPVTELQNLPLNDFQCHSCEGNSTHGCSSEETSLVACRGPMNQCLEVTGSTGLGDENFTVRGCATPSWCQGLHMAESFGFTDHSISCCLGNGCNDPARDTQPRTGGAPQLAPAYLSLIATTLLTVIRP
ncbi:urokinase plasminogen activator surface receptor [Erinaceus europaeus]|uniref:Urokinase plasminogen activator surface receptor n=1 Tax=Erinaceus europaeus TaxID=9365 RepID=A0ABM3X072_ERIEU|nr:urokinase plasminogen activator surface receptor [Erinaceus europaeus]